MRRAGGLLPGLKLNAATGLITGHPTPPAGRYTVHASAHDSQAQTAGTSFVWTVGALPAISRLSLHQTAGGPQLGVHGQRRTGTRRTSGRSQVAVPHVLTHRHRPRHRRDHAPRASPTAPAVHRCRRSRAATVPTIRLRRDDIAACASSSPRSSSLRPRRTGGRLDVPPAPGGHGQRGGRGSRGRTRLSGQGRASPGDDAAEGHVLGRDRRPHRPLLGRGGRSVADAPRWQSGPRTASTWSSATTPTAARAATSSTTPSSPRSGARVRASRYEPAPPADLHARASPTTSTSSTASWELSRGARPRPHARHLRAVGRPRARSGCWRGHSWSARCARWRWGGRAEELAPRGGGERG